jgi:hypothetical protein
MMRFRHYVVFGLPAVMLVCSRRRLRDRRSSPTKALDQEREKP